MWFIRQISPELKANVTNILAVGVSGFKERGSLASFRAPLVGRSDP